MLVTIPFNARCVLGTPTYTAGVKIEHVDLPKPRRDDELHSNSPRKDWLARASASRWDPKLQASAPEALCFEMGVVAESTSPGRQVLRCYSDNLVEILFCLRFELFPFLEGRAWERNVGVVSAALVGWCRSHPGRLRSLSRLSTPMSLL
jgi:hypothetical protein